MNGMADPKDEILQLLKEVRDLLVPISGCFEEQYREKKVKQFRGMLTPVRQRIYPLLLDDRRLLQEAIADDADTSQPTVSRFVTKLMESGLIREGSDSEGNPVYEDVFDLRRIAEVEDDED